MTFAELDLSGEIAALALKQGWESPTPIQTVVIPSALEGRDILGGAPTGTGKSAAFLLPIISRLTVEPGPAAATRALILEPTRELALQLSSAAASLCADLEGLEVGSIVGGAGREEQKNQHAAIVAATPGRLLECLHKGWFDPRSVEILVIDEADRMLDLGFRDDVAELTRALSCRRQTMLFSATLEGAGIREFAAAVLNEPLEVRLGAGGEAGTGEKLPENLQSRAYYAASDDKRFQILEHLITTSRTRSIIFVRTAERVDKDATRLHKCGFKTATLKGEMTQTERQAAIARFRSGGAELLVATDVAARGLDLPEVMTVYNYDLPGNAAIYLHRAGRTARAGSRGVVASLVTAAELGRLTSIERYTGREIERRQIKGLCASFDTAMTSGSGSGKKSRALARGGFAKKQQSSGDTPRVKDRWRDRKNVGKPGLAAKRQRRLARQEHGAQEQA